MMSSANTTPASATSPLATLERLVKNGVSRTATIAAMRINSPINGCSAIPALFQPGMNGLPTSASGFIMRFYVLPVTRASSPCERHSTGWKPVSQVTATAERRLFVVKSLVLLRKQLEHRRHRLIREDEEKHRR